MNNTSILSSAQPYLQWIRIVMIMSLLLTIPLLAQAETVNDQSAEPEQYVKIRLLPEKTHVKAGEDIWIGIEQAIQPHWHTYWIYPGDSGTPTSASWSMPEGFEISNIYWPAPEKIPYGPLTNYGYSENVILLQKLTIPQTIPDGPIELMADIELLVCKEICIPEYGTYTLTLNGDNESKANNSAYLDNARKALPKTVDWGATFTQNAQGAFELTLKDHALGTNTNIDPQSLTMLPLDWGVVENSAKTNVSVTEDGRITLTQKRADRNLENLQNFRSLIVQTHKDGTKTAYTVSAEPLNIADKKATSADSSVPAHNYTNADGAPTIPLSLAGALWWAFLGGIILNLMPCVFPVLSIKALSLVKISEKKPALARLHGLAYTAGVILSFMLIAGILIALQSAGSEVGWAFHMQNPLIVSAIAILLFLVGMNLIGFFEIPSRFGNIGSKLTQGQNINSSFFTGVLATLVATPCTGPFMGAAIGFALVQTPLIGLSVFAALGFGMALPYLLISFIPNLQRIMPKPGMWMERFKEILAFPMFASSAFFVGVLSQQANSITLFGVLLIFVLISFIIWLKRNFPKGSKNWMATLAIIMALVGIFFLIPSSNPIAPQPQNGVTNTDTNIQKTMFGMPFSHEALGTALEGHKPVFVEMTAAWCITCKYNHAVAINVQSTKTLFKEKDVQYFIGDWTNQDPEITKYLKTFGRNGVPIYVYYGPRQENGERPKPQLLPQILTTGIVAQAIGQ